MNPGSRAIQRLRDWASRLKQETFALYLAARHPRTRWPVRLLIAGLVAYALSPIDLIPDFIPILGWLDDLLIVPLGLSVVRRLIPDPLWTELHAAADAASERPSSRAGLAFILLLWAMLLYLVYWAVRTSPWH